jgi:hypothetical protein
VKLHRASRWHLFKQLSAYPQPVRLESLTYDLSVEFDSRLPARHAGCDIFVLTGTFFKGTVVWQERNLPHALETCPTGLDARIEIHAIFDNFSVTPQGDRDRSK